MRPIELAPVKHCLPVLRSPGTDHRDMAHTQAHKHTLYKQWKSADTQQQSQVASHYLTQSNKARKIKEKEVTQWGVWVGGSDNGGVSAVNFALKNLFFFFFRPDCGNKMFFKMLPKKFQCLLRLVGQLHKNRQKYTHSSRALSTLKHHFQ